MRERRLTAEFIIQEFIFQEYYLLATITLSPFRLVRAAKETKI